MDSLVSMGTGAAVIYNLWNLIEITLGIDPVGKAMDLYFESAGVLIALISLGKYFEQRSKLKTSDAIKSLLKLSPDKATILRGEEEECVNVEEIEPGGTIQIFLMRINRGFMLINIEK